MSEEMVTRTLDECASVLQVIGRRLYRAGQLPATSGNLSLRMDRETCAITASGRDKGRLSRGDVVPVSLSMSEAGGQGKPVSLTHPSGEAAVVGPRPSAETPLHTSLYRRYPDIGAVFHTHSRAATVISRFLTRDELTLEAYELGKAFRGVTDSGARVRIPVFDNEPDMGRLSRRVLDVLEQCSEGPAFAYLIRSHGSYVWGATWQEASRHLEALEFMLVCELDARCRTVGLGRSAT